MSTYGYWAIACISHWRARECPSPAIQPIAAALIVGSSNTTNIWFVVAAASAGAIMGDNIGYWVGREIGFRLKARIKLGQYLCLRHGGKVVFFGRFVAVLRALAAFLAGANCMEWPRFLLFNAADGIVWATVYGFSAWFLDKEIFQVAGPVGMAVAVLVVIVAVGDFLLVRSREKELKAAA